MVWRPFQLNKDAPIVGVNKQRMYESKFGVERTKMMMARLSGIGAELGIRFSLGGKTGNTLQSHRLVELALATGGATLQNKVIENIFKLYFEDEGDITQDAGLVTCAVDAGLPRDVVAAMLENPATPPTADALSQSVAEYRHRYQVTGVPFFIVGGSRFSGAQDKAVLVEVLETELQQETV